MKLEEYKKVQKAAKEVHAQLCAFIDAKSTEQSIAEKAVELMLHQGISETWYYDTPAFVLLGSRSCLSVSGKDYVPSDEAVGETNLITVDLSPMTGDVWGDCARSFYVEGGVCTTRPQSAAFKEGSAAELELHRLMKEFVSPSTKFSELFEFGNRKIQALGYENLDFLGNLGHSIETAPSKRRFIDASCHEQLGAVKFFTFEPHIKKVQSNWGFKHENIYYFDHDGSVLEL